MSRRSLLGLDDDSNKRLLYAEETEDVFDRETEVDLERLGHKVAEMKNVRTLCVYVYICLIIHF